MELREVMVRTSDGETLVDDLADIEKVTPTLSQALTPTIEGPSKLEKSWEIPE